MILASSKKVASLASASALLVILCVLSLQNSRLTLAGSQNNTKVLELLKSVDPCVTQMVYSFLYPQSRLPTSPSELVTICKAQTEAFKCVREKSKVAPALIKRGLAGLVSTRQRHSKKYCAQPASELSRKFLEANKCILGKKLDIYRKTDELFAKQLLAIKAANFNNSTPELNHLCCASINWRRNIVLNLEPECSQHKEVTEEMVTSIISSEINLICEDEEKLLAKICPKLEPLKLDKGSFRLEPGNSPSISALYLVATLGERDE